MGLMGSRGKDDFPCSDGTFSGDLVCGAMVIWKHLETALQRCCCIINGPQSPMALPVDGSKSLPFRSDSPISNI